jgi:outer membrane protein assembly factor BamB
MIRSLVFLAAVTAVVSACGGKDGSSPPANRATTVASVSTRPVVPPERPLARTFITVVDGDTGKAVSGVEVSVAGRRSRTDPSGRAVVARPDRPHYAVRLQASGYIPRKERVRASRRALRLVLYRRAAQWPYYGVTPSRAQVQASLRLRPPFRVVWSRAFGGLLEFPAVVWEGMGYVNTAKGVLTAFHMETGRVAWRRKVGGLMASSPGIDEDRHQLVVTSMEPGYVSVVDMRTGRTRWRYDTGRAEPSPVVHNGIAYLAATNGRVYALDMRTRKARWVFRGGAKITSSPALVGRRLYVGDYAGRVFALDARTGRRIWTGSAGSRVYGTVAVAGGKVFAPSVFSGLSALSARSGRLLWRVPVGAYLYSSPAVYRGRVYFGTYADFVHCAAARSGRILWRRYAGGRVSGAVEVVRGVVYASTFRRTTGWDWRTGKRLWAFPHGEYVPLSGNGRVLLVHGHSQIWAVEPRRRR